MAIDLKGLSYTTKEFVMFTITLKEILKNVTMQLKYQSKGFFKNPVNNIDLMRTKRSHYSLITITEEFSFFI